MWFNITIHAQSELFTAIRELEFALLHLIQQLDELITTVQFVSQGHWSINFVNPTVLLGILKNVSLQLPSNHTLIAVIRSENIHMYYELIKVSIIATPHNLKLLLNVPLKTPDLRFTIFKIITLPERTSSGKFVQYFVDYAYFGLNDHQRDYFLSTEAQYDDCAKSCIVICPANTVIFNSQTLTYEASLFFQNTNSAHLCKRKILLRHQTPTLLRHAGLWIYFYLE
jgi:hypothetical protein